MMDDHHRDYIECPLASGFDGMKTGDAGTIQILFMRGSDGI